MIIQQHGHQMEQITGTHVKDQDVLQKAELQDIHGEVGMEIQRHVQQEEPNIGIVAYAVGREAQEQVH